ncbi:helix-turn-helix domain-containing protein [Sulfitobacter aestuariivivens]|uniref:helix-turn-helix domain-containing protein n=1 Tax=Sulfitobacter aestuariivivens TaxID=2766981 RepID=UPI0036126C0C
MIRDGMNAPANTFASHLKLWRKRRRMSQHDLAMSASVSGRHVSFLESGRSQPSRNMILHLSEILDVPKQGRNAMLTAAGMAQIYGSRPLDDAELAPVRRALTWMLNRHMPYPAFAMDRHWTIIDLNDSARSLFSAFGVAEGDNLLSTMLENDVVQNAIENFSELAEHLRERAVLESAYQGGDPVLDAFAGRLDAHIDESKAHEFGTLPPSRPRSCALVISLFRS